MSLKDEIAKAKAAIENADPTDLDVVLNGELKRLTFKPLLGSEWDDLTAAHPPRPTSAPDNDAGYNVDAVSAAYPVAKITVEGETPDAEDWAELVRTLASPDRKNISAVLWGINKYEHQQILIALGKARKG